MHLHCSTRKSKRKFLDFTLLGRRIHSKRRCPGSWLAFPASWDKPYWRTFVRNQSSSRTAAVTMPFIHCGVYNCQTRSAVRFQTCPSTKALMGKCFRQRTRSSCLPNKQNWVPESQPSPSNPRRGQPQRGPQQHLKWQRPNPVGSEEMEEVEATMQPQAPREVARGRPEGPATSPIRHLRAVITISGGGLQLGFVCPPWPVPGKTIILPDQRRRKKIERLTSSTVRNRILTCSWIQCTIVH